MISLEFCQKVDLNWIGAFFFTFFIFIKSAKAETVTFSTKLVWFFWTEKRWKPWCSIVNKNKSVFWSSSGERRGPIRVLSPSQSIHQLPQFPFKGLMKNLGKRGGKKNIPSILEADSESWAPAAPDSSWHFLRIYYPLHCLDELWQQQARVRLVCPFPNRHPPTRLMPANL